MNKKPVVAIVGRPNVGKSTLFNKLADRRISIVDDQPGVTRDRVYADCEWLTNKFLLIDTGGIETRTDDVLLSQMRDQARLAIDSADVVVYLCNGRETYTTADLEIAEMLRKFNKPIILVLNKVDQYKRPPHFYDYYDLGFGEPFMISSVNKMGLGDLLDEIVANFPKNTDPHFLDSSIKIAVIGKPNAGKSSLINKLTGEDRAIVSDIPGTTRDAIDTQFRARGKDYVLIDTAGIRRKAKVKDDIEKYSVLRAMTAVERADVCLVVIDAVEGITEQDKKVAGLAHDAGKPAIFVVNKWDLIEKDNKSTNEFSKRLKEEFPFMMYALVGFVSALTGQRVPSLMDLVDRVYENSSRRISTGVVNEVINEAIALSQVPSDKGRRLKIFYASQVAVRPPTFMLAVNSKSLAHFSYIRYIENRLRKNFEFEGTPIKFNIKERNEASR